MLIKIIDKKQYSIQNNAQNHISIVNIILVCMPSRISIHQYKLSILFYPCVFVCLENRIVEKDSIENGFLFFVSSSIVYCIPNHHIRCMHAFEVILYREAKFVLIHKLLGNYKLTNIHFTIFLIMNIW